MRALAVHTKPVRGASVSRAVRSTGWAPGVGRIVPVISNRQAAASGVPGATACRR